MQPTVAVAIPCYNEAPTVGKVVDDFRRELPEATVYVLDNASTDATAEIAAAHGAIVQRVKRRGKGEVVSRLMERLEPAGEVAGGGETIAADIVVMVDGDDTYPAEKVRELLAPVLAGEADMVIGTRLETYGKRSFRPLHVMGNRLVRGLINLIFRADLRDILSGYRAFTAELARSVPVTAVGFEIETELTCQTLYHGFVIRQVPVPYRQRPPGSVSKLRTFRDGFRVLWTIFNIARSFKPLTFFGSLAILLALLGILAALPGTVEYFREGQVHRFPLLFVGVGLVILSFISATVGVLLHAINVRFKEVAVLLRKASRRT